MTAWGIVLSIVVYIGTGLGLALWAKPDGEEMEPGDFLVWFLWPLALIGGFVLWLMKLVFD